MKVCRLPDWELEVLLPIIAINCITDFPTEDRERFASQFLLTRAIEVAELEREDTRGRALPNFDGSNPLCILTLRVMATESSGQTPTG